MARIGRVGYTLEDTAGTRRSSRRSRSILSARRLGTNIRSRYTEASEIARYTCRVDSSESVEDSRIDRKLSRNTSSNTGFEAGSSRRRAEAEVAYDISAAKAVGRNYTSDRS